MTKEERLSLITDLCGRIPYRPKGVKLNGYFDPTDVMLCGYNGHWVEVFPANGDYDEIWVEDFRLYLRPLSSMTEEEENEWRGFNIDPLLEAVGKPHTRIEDLMLIAKSQYEPLNWLNAHHFDYRGLIEKGLALEAPEEMYND